MFSSKHAIWKFANAGDELDDWLPYAEELVHGWAAQNCDEVKFRNTFDIILAAYLLEDELLPPSARAAFSQLMLTVISEVTTKKLEVDSLHIQPPKPGRKSDRRQTFVRLHAVKTLVAAGTSETEAYRLVGERHFKSPDTIRREYERIVKNPLKKEQAGKIKR